MSDTPTDFFLGNDSVVRALNETMISWHSEKARYIPAYAGVLAKNEEVQRDFLTLLRESLLESLRDDKGPADIGSCIDVLLLNFSAEQATCSNKEYNRVIIFAGAFRHLYHPDLDKSLDSAWESVRWSHEAMIIVVAKCTVGGCAKLKNLLRRYKSGRVLCLARSSCTGWAVFEMRMPLPVRDADPFETWEAEHHYMASRRFCGTTHCRNPNCFVGRVQKRDRTASGDDSENASGDAPEHDSGDAPEHASGDAPEHASGDAPEHASDDDSDDDSENASDDDSDDDSENASDDDSDDDSENASDDDSENASDDDSENASDDDSENASGDAPENPSDDDSGDASEPDATPSGNGADGGDENPTKRPRTDSGAEGASSRTDPRPDYPQDQAASLMRMHARLSKENRAALLAVARSLTAPNGEQ